MAENLSQTPEPIQNPAEPEVISPTESEKPENPPESAPSAFGGDDVPGLVKLISPEIVVLVWAIIIDLVNIIIVCFGLDDFGIVDAVGIVTISFWSFLRTQTVVAPSRAQTKAKNFLRKIFTGKWGKFLTPVIGELIPYIGVLPFWSVGVYYQLTE